jgi:hypothetical protein
MRRDCVCARECDGEMDRKVGDSPAFEAAAFGRVTLY